MGNGRKAIKSEASEKSKVIYSSALSITSSEEFGITENAENS
jgi:hypothetical protein